MQQWNFTIQRSLWAGWTVSGIYSGSKGVKLFGGNYNLNQLDPRSTSLKASRSRPRCPTPSLGRSRPARWLGHRAAVAPAPAVPGLPDGPDLRRQQCQQFSFHSFQMFLEKRFSGGISALVSYTGSKLISDNLSDGGAGNAASLGDFRIGAYNRRLEKAIDRMTSTAASSSAVWWNCRSAAAASSAPT
jgi:hypothetical protein